MDYRFLDPGPEELKKNAACEREGVLAVAVRTTGFDLERDEVVELALSDGTGRLLFHERVKPQNIETWEASDASGGLAPAAVEDAPELYQFEDQIAELFQNASVVVALHGSYARDAIEASWVALPNRPIFDLTQEFCAAHDTADYPGVPAAAASLSSMVDYYGLAVDGGRADSVDAASEAQLLAALYQAYVQEAVDQVATQPASYWSAYQARLASEEATARAAAEQQRLSALKTARINAILWLCAAAIFANLAVQMGVREGEPSLVVMVAAVAVFFAFKWVRSLMAVVRLSKQNPGSSGDSSASGQ